MSEADTRTELAELRDIARRAELAAMQALAEARRARARLLEVDREPLPDANQVTASLTHKSIWRRAVDWCWELWEWSDPSSYTVPRTGTKPLVMMRSVEDSKALLRYGTINALAKSVLAEVTASGAVTIDSTVPSIGATVTTYDAGDGIDLTGTTFSLDLTVDDNTADLEVDAGVIGFTGGQQYEPYQKLTSTTYGFGPLRGIVS